jgi:hypothetical protein
MGSLQGISGALHLGIFDRPEKKIFSTDSEELPPGRSLSAYQVFLYDSNPRYEE